MIDELFTSIEDLMSHNRTKYGHSARELLVLFWNPRIFSFVIFQIDQINRLVSIFELWICSDILLFDLQILGGQ